MQFRRAATHQASINIAPLVDVVFLLVIFFAVSTTFLETAGLKLELPASSSTTDREPREITVLLASDGALSFEGEDLTLSELAPALKTALEDSERRIVVLRADRTAQHGDVVKVMDVVRGAGAEALTIAAQSGASQ